MFWFCVSIHTLFYFFSLSCYALFCDLTVRGCIVEAGRFWRERLFGCDHLQSSASVSLLLWVLPLASLFRNHFLLWTPVAMSVLFIQLFVPCLVSEEDLRCFASLWICPGSPSRVSLFFLSLYFFSSLVPYISLSLTQRWLINDRWWR